MELAFVLVTVLVILVTVLPWLGLSRRSASIVAPSIVLLCAAISYSWFSRQITADPGGESLGSLPKTGRPGGYVTSDTCESCHPSQYNSWHQSFHRTMTQPATPETAQAVFQGHTLVTAEESFSLQQEGDSFFTYVLPTAAPKTEAPSIAPDRKQIDMITGSHHMQVFWLANGHGNLQIGFPFTWLKSDQRWVPRGETFLHDPADPPPRDVWNNNCLRCHTTASQSRPDKEHELFDTRVGELGIACESCHGPAETHVNANRNPLRRASFHKGRDADPTIIQPGRLDHVRSSQVCGNCHSMKWFEVNEDWRQNGFSYLPGQDLEKLNPIVRPNHLAELPAEAQDIIKRHPAMTSEFFWPDGMMRVSGREFNGLMESPCYQRGQLGCLSCHSLHQSNPTNQLARGMESNEACLQCHEKMRANVTAHTHHPKDSPGSLCYNCHMPYTTYGLLKGIRSHQITNPSAQNARETGRPDACSLCHLDRPLSWTSKHLTEWYRQKPAELDDDAQRISAAVLWLVRGDAGQRVLIASSMGRAAVRQASGDNWFAPYLGLLLDDPYSAVRYVAGHSLQLLPAFNDLQYDFVGEPAQFAVASAQVIKHWNQDLAPKNPKARAELLIGEDGTWNNAEVQRLLSHRDTRPVHLRE